MIITSSATFNLATYSGCTGGGVTITNPQSGCAGSDNYNYATLKQSVRNQSGYCYYFFDSIDIPSGATNITVSCSAKGYASDSYGYNYQKAKAELMSDGNVKSSSSDFASTVSTYTFSGGQWSVSDFNQPLCLRLCLFSSTDADMGRNVRFYGASIEVSYVYNAKYVTTAVTFYPTSFVSGTYRTIENQNAPIGQGTASTAEAKVYLRTGSTATTYAFWKIDCSSIPSGAVINSVTCQAKALCSAGSVSVKTIGIYTATTTGASVGIPATMTGSSWPATGMVVTIGLGDWGQKASDYDDCYIGVYLRRSRSGSTTQYCSFFGAELTVNYTYSDVNYDVTIVNNSTSATTFPTGGTETVYWGATYYIMLQSIDQQSEIDERKIKITDNGNVLPLSAFSVETYEQYTWYTYEFEVNENHIFTFKDVGEVCYQRRSGIWSDVSWFNVYKKINNAWVQQETLEGVFQDDEVYFTGSTGDITTVQFGVNGILKQNDE